MIEQPTLGFIGVGVMGEKICGTLAQKSGHPAFAYDQNPVLLERLSAHGVETAASIYNHIYPTEPICGGISC